jgi:hypothetical protein
VRPKWSNSALPALNLRASEADKREYFNPGGYYQNLSDVLFQADNNGASTESLGIPVGTSISAEWSPNPNAQQPGQPTKFIKLVGPLTYTRIPLSAIQVAVS